MPVGLNTNHLSLESKTAAPFHPSWGANEHEAKARLEVMMRLLTPLLSFWITHTHVEGHALIEIVTRTKSGGTGSKFFYLDDSGGMYDVENREQVAKDDEVWRQFNYFDIVRGVEQGLHHGFGDSDVRHETRRYFRGLLFMFKEEIGWIDNTDMS